MSDNYTSEHDAQCWADNVAGTIVQTENGYVVAGHEHVDTSGQPWFKVWSRSACVIVRGDRKRWLAKQMVSL